MFAALGGFAIVLYIVNHLTRKSTLKILAIGAVYLTIRIICWIALWILALALLAASMNGH
jgi:hypothetical protein